jgi:hypothetical protein
LVTGQLVGSLSSGENAPLFLHTVTFSPDGRTVATATRKGEILLWDMLAGHALVKLAGHRGGVETLGFSPDGARLVSGGAHDTMILVWDVTPWTRRARQDKPLDAKLAADLWNQLARQGEGNAAGAYAAIGRFLESPKEAVAFLRPELKAVTDADMAEIAKLIADLNSDVFAVRDRANGKLSAFGLEAQPALLRILNDAPNLEVRQRVKQLLGKFESKLPPQSIQTIRALELLEMLGTSEAIDHLEALARGAQEAWLTQEAAASLARVKKRMAAS